MLMAYMASRELPQFQRITQDPAAEMDKSDSMSTLFGNAEKKVRLLHETTIVAIEKHMAQLEDPDGFIDMIEGCLGEIHTRPSFETLTTELKYFRRKSAKQSSQQPSRVTLTRKARKLKPTE
jgi:hypothetical protein